MGPSQPDGGSSGKVMDSSSTSMMASQKLGNDKPTSERMRMHWSVPLPLCTAACMPSGTDTSTDKNNDTSASASVAGKASAISRDTGVPPMKLLPRSPTTAPRRNSKYCTAKGRSSPSPSRMLRRSSSVTLPAPWASINAGSPDSRTA
ncbi:hypothetical protein D3C71_1525370 [compost metagenome]